MLFIAYLSFKNRFKRFVLVAFSILFFSASISFYIGLPIDGIRLVFKQNPGQKISIYPATNEKGIDFSRPNHSEVVQSDRDISADILFPSINRKQTIFAIEIDPGTQKNPSAFDLVSLEFYSSSHWGDQSLYRIQGESMLSFVSSPPSKVNKISYTNDCLHSEPRSVKNSWLIVNLNKSNLEYLLKQKIVGKYLLVLIYWIALSVILFLILLFSFKFLFNLLKIKTSIHDKNPSSKKWLQYAIIVIALLVFAELIAFTGYSVLSKHLFSWSEFQSMRREKISVDPLEKVRHTVKKKSESSQKKSTTKRERLREVLHPYLGYVYDGNSEKLSIHGLYDKRIVNHKSSPVTLQNDENYIIGIFGGSFAYGVSIGSSDGYIEKKFEQMQPLRNKELIIHTVAFGGWKQPQQLLALNYFLSLGAHFDIVINIDGFNDIVLPYTENVPKGVYPHYPRMHWFRTGNLKDEDMLALMGTIALYKKKRMKYARFFSKKPLCFSVWANLVWRYYDALFSQKKYSAEKTLANYKIKKSSQLNYESKGPPFYFDTDRALFQELAKVWSLASLQMAQLCKANNIDYFHFLQPNQYVRGSKPMTIEEKRVAWSDDHSYKKSVEQGYPLLIQRGKWLLSQNVDFHDLTMLFVDNKDVLYRDMCCHLNEEGYDLIVDKIVEVLQTKYDKGELLSVK